MQRFCILMVLSFLVALLLTPVQITAQESTGGLVVAGYVDDLEFLNPFMCASLTCDRITSLLFPSILGVDPASGQHRPGARGALALDWQISPDNHALTITLRDDLFWSDGEQVTAEDILFGHRVLDEGGLHITVYLDTRSVDIDAPDPFTVVFTFDEANCDTLFTVAQIPVVPAHVFDGDTSKTES